MLKSGQYQKTKIPSKRDDSDTKYKKLQGVFEETALDPQNTNLRGAHGEEERDLLDEIIKNFNERCPKIIAQDEAFKQAMQSTVRRILGN